MSPQAKRWPYTVSAKGSLYPFSISTNGGRSREMSCPAWLSLSSLSPGESAPLESHSSLLLQRWLFSLLPLLSGTARLSAAPHWGIPPPSWICSCKVMTYFSDLPNSPAQIPHEQENDRVKLNRGGCCGGVVYVRIQAEVCYRTSQGQRGSD